MATIRVRVFELSQLSWWLGDKIGHVIQDSFTFIDTTQIIDQKRFTVIALVHCWRIGTNTNISCDGTAIIDNNFVYQGKWYRNGNIDLIQFKSNLITFSDGMVTFQGNSYKAAVDHDYSNMFGITVNGITLALPFSPGFGIRIKANDGDIVANNTGQLWQLVPGLMVGGLRKQIDGPGFRSVFIMTANECYIIGSDSNVVIDRQLIINYLKSYKSNHFNNLTFNNIIDIRC